MIKIYENKQLMFFNNAKIIIISQTFHKFNLLKFCNFLLNINKKFFFNNKLKNK